MMSPTIFIIDESPAIHRLIEEESLEEGFTIRSFTDAPTALEEARACPPEMIIADYHLEGLTFTTFCEKLGEHDIIPTSYLILLAGSTDQYEEASMLTRGVQGFLHKPLKKEHLVDMFEEFYEAEKEREQKKSKKPKSWPPETTMVDLEAPFLLDDLESEEEPIQIEIIQPTFPQVTLTEKQEAGNLSPKSEARDRAMSRSTSQDVPPAIKAKHVDKNLDPVSTEQPSAPLNQKVQGNSSPDPTPIAPSSETGESLLTSSEHKALPEERDVHVDAPIISPNLRLGRTFPKLDDQQTAVSSTAAAGAVFHKKPKGLPTERSPMAQAQDPTPELPPQLETAMRGFLNQLTQTVGQPTTGQNHQFEDLVKQTVATQLPLLVQQEVERSLSSRLDEDHLKTLIHAVVQETLPEMIEQQIRTNEKALQETLRHQTQEQIESVTAKLVQELTEPAIKKCLPTVMKEQAETVDGLVKETAVELVMPHVQGSIDQVVREVVGGRIEELVQTVVPDLAEQHIKKEIERLTAPE